MSWKSLLYSKLRSLVLLSAVALLLLEESTRNDRGVLLAECSELQPDNFVSNQNTLGDDVGGDNDREQSGQDDEIGGHNDREQSGQEKQMPSVTERTSTVDEIVATSPAGRPQQNSQNEELRLARSSFLDRMDRSCPKGSSIPKNSTVSSKKLIYFTTISGDATKIAPFEINLKDELHAADDCVNGKVVSSRDIMKHVTKNYSETEGKSVRLLFDNRPLDMTSEKEEFCISLAETVTITVVLMQSAGLDERLNSAMRFWRNTQAEYWVREAETEIIRIFLECHPHLKLTKLFYRLVDGYAVYVLKREAYFNHHPTYYWKQEIKTCPRTDEGISRHKEDFFEALSFAASFPTQHVQKSRLAQMSNKYDMASFGFHFERWLEEEEEKTRRNNTQQGVRSLSVVPPLATNHRARHVKRFIAEIW